MAQECIDAYIRGGDTAHLAALDVVRAFPRVNHDAVLIKLFERNFPQPIIDLISGWFLRASFKVKWCNHVSDSFIMRTGINQGSVLAPFIFALLMDDNFLNCTYWLHYDKGIILVYADDISLITRSRKHLQEFFSCVESELGRINLQLNAKKCTVMRVGPLFDKPCVPILTSARDKVPMVNVTRYLGVHFVAGRTFRVSMDLPKRSFNRAANSILGRLQGSATEDVLFHLITTKAVPILLFATESVNLSKSVIASLDFCVLKFVMKIFKSSNRDLVLQCLQYFNFKLPSSLLVTRKEKFTSAFT